MTLLPTLLAGLVGLLGRRSLGGRAAVLKTDGGQPQGFDSSAFRRDEGGPAEYLYVDAHGGLVTVDLSTQDFSNEMTDEANAVRELQGHEPLTWYRVEIDNREGSADVSLDSIQVVTVDGETIDAVISMDNLPELPEMDGENGVYNRNVYAQHAFINSYPDGLPGSIGETQATFPGLDDLDSIRFVYVNGERADPN